MTFKAFLSLMIVALLYISATLQILIDSSYENIVSVLVITTVTLITISYLYWVNAYSEATISSVILLILLFTSIYGALLFQTLYWNPVTIYLYDPIYTFSKLSVYLIIAILSHYVYLIYLAGSNRKLNNNVFSIRSFLSKIGLFNVPSVYTVWSIALIGVVAMIIGKSLPGSIGRAIFNFNFLIWFPFFIILYIYKFGKLYATPKTQYICISVYLTFIVVIGIGFNTRSLIVTGLVNLFLVSIVILLNSNVKKSFGFYSKFLFFILVIFAFIKPLSDFSQAMLIARADRGDISPVQMLDNTINLYLDSKTLDETKSKKYIEQKIYSNYDEDYIENTILTRFVLTKFHDNAYYYKSLLTDDGKNTVKNHIEAKVISILPQPILDILNIEINKMEYMNTTTDILVHETTGRRMGGFKVPSAFVELEILFGIFGYIIFSIMLILFFIVTELFTTVSKRYGFFITFPFFAAASKYLIFQIPVYGMTGMVTLITRGFLEDILIFTSLIFLFSFIFKHFNLDTGMKKDHHINLSNSKFTYDKKDVSQISRVNY